MAAKREPEPSAVILDSRTLRSSPESGERAGYDGAKRKRGANMHLAVDTPGHVVALHVTLADVDDRAEVGWLPAEVQAETGDIVEWALSFRAIPVPSPRPPRRPTASSWRWSRRRKPSAALCCCRAAGWWSAPSMDALKS
ncbi:hypothetical protein Mext_0539 [Methylorubrum extorquens PA1]|nr:hypothetical protein Mext_0539 [Methylorubrum extorquens PA1]